jgi:hypothetical protein
VSIRLDEARERLRQITGGFAWIRKQLLEIKGGLKGSRRESSHEDLDADPSPSTEIRTVIDCVLRDSLDPAIRDLLDAANYHPGKSGAASGRKGRKKRSRSPDGAGGELSLTDSPLFEEGNLALQQVISGVKDFKKKTGGSEEGGVGNVVKGA